MENEPEDQPEKDSEDQPDDQPPNLPPTPSTPLNAIQVREIKAEMSKSYIDYAMSVIIGRAIPDVRDGLKPVHRRILYSMAENNFYYNTPTRKCARIVGDVLGRYHPHGDMAVYDALVRMAQPFSLRYMLIDGQGNFGSVDGDPAAAMRYTEARLAKITNELLEDLEKNTVEFTDNFDGSLKEPMYLPSKLPNILINGVSGIAVGMSTNMAPHNLKEVCSAICAAIDMGPEQLTPEDVIPYIKGPDFPTGGIIMGKQGIIDAIRTGRGSITIRAKTEIITDERGKGKDVIIVSEIPYMVNKTVLIENMADLVNRGVLPEIADVRDESDRTGMRIYIELKKNSDSHACLNRLFMKTALQQKFGIINLVLVNDGKQPKILNYAELIQHYLKHRLDVVRRRIEFDLAKAQKRLHLIEGLLIAIDNIDEVVALIKKSANTEEAGQTLMTKFGLDEVQADEILKMPLSRLTNLQTQKILDEKQELIGDISKYQSILADKAKIYEIIKSEVQKMSEDYGDERRTELVETSGEILMNIAETVPEEDCVFMITQNQMIKRMTLANYQSQHRGGKGKKGMQIREEDLIQDMFIASSRDTILLFTQQGRVYSIPAYKLPLATRTGKGKAIVNYINAKPEERVIDLINVSNFDDTTKTLVFITKLGTIKKTNLSEFHNIRSPGIQCMNVREGDHLLSVKVCNPNDHILIPTKKGQAVHFEESELRPIGRTAMGVRGITLRESDEVVDLVVSTPDTHILSITKKGYGKVSPIELYRLTHRGGKGVINMKFHDETDDIIAVKALVANENLLLASKKGHLIRIRSDDVRVTGRAAKGVIVMKFDDETDEITSVAICDAEDETLCDTDIIPKGEQGEITEEEEPEEEEEAPVHNEIKKGKGKKGESKEETEDLAEEPDDDESKVHHKDEDED
jgi:DNA gyrase subunit A